MTLQLHSFSCTRVAAFAVIQMCVLCIMLLAPSDALAAGERLEAVICDVVYLVTGSIGKPVATAAIVGIALMAMFGRISWGIVMVTVTGIVMVFSAGQIVKVVTGSTACGGAFSVGGGEIPEEAPTAVPDVGSTTPATGCCYGPGFAE